jgi:hypothetical protein
MQTLIAVSASAAFIVLGLLILLLLREQICEFLKINQRIAQQQRIITLLEEQNQLIARRQQRLLSLSDLARAEYEEEEES